MTLSHLLQPLENRRFLSVTPIITPAPVGLISEPVSEYAGLSQKVRIGYLPELTVEHVAQLHGEVDWGDNTSSPASFERDKKGGIDVVATHTYIKPGTFSVGSFLTLTPPADPGHPIPEFIMVLGTVDTTATVTIAPPQITQTVDQAFTATLGKFVDVSAGVTLSVKINWGDGHVIYDGTIANAGLYNGNWQVGGSHTYLHTGTYLAHAYVYSQVAGSKSAAKLVKEFEVLVHVTN